MQQISKQLEMIAVKVEVNQVPTLEALRWTASEASTDVQRSDNKDFRNALLQRYYPDRMAGTERDVTCMITGKRLSSSLFCSPFLSCKSVGHRVGVLHHANQVQAMLQAPAHA